MSIQTPKGFLIERIAELGSPIDWQKCIDDALAEHGLGDIPEAGLLLRSFVSDALRHHLEAKFGEEKVAPVINDVLAQFGTPAPVRKQTIDGAKHARRLSAMITLPPQDREHAPSAIIEALGVSDKDLEAFSKLVPHVQIKAHTSSIAMMNAARESSGRQIFLIDARSNMKKSSLETLLSVLKVGQTVLWVKDPETLDLAKNTKRVVCDERVTTEDIAALLRIAFFTKK